MRPKIYNFVLAAATAMGACSGGLQPGGAPADPNMPDTPPVVATNLDYEQALRTAARAAASRAASP